MPYAQVGDIKLYYEVHGDGPPVVLVPGLGSDTRLFVNVVPVLATLHQVIVVDPRGGGQSDKPRGGYSIEQMAEDVAGLFATLGIARADVWATRWEARSLCSWRQPSRVGRTSGPRGHRGPAAVTASVLPALVDDGRRLQDPAAAQGRRSAVVCLRGAAAASKSFDGRGLLPR